MGDCFVSTHDRNIRINAMLTVVASKFPSIILALSPGRLTTKPSSGESEDPAAVVLAEALDSLRTAERMLRGGNRDRREANMFNSQLSKH